MGSTMILALIYMMFVIIVVMAVAVIAFYNLLKGSEEKRDATNGNRPESVLVPDNVKKESQSVSTQKNDAKVYDVDAEKKALLSKGYHRVGEGKYQKRDKVYSSVPENYIKEKEYDPIDDKKEYNPIDNKNEHKKIFTGNDEEDDDPIKDK